MKNINLFATAFAVLVLAAGCSKVLEVNNDTTLPVGDATIVKAGFEQTKTQLQSDGKKVYWESGDAIAINGEASEALSISSPAAEAEFSFSATLADEKNAVYPSSIWVSEGTVCLSAEQPAGTNMSFGQNALPMVAYTASGNSLTFKHVSAVIKVQLKAGATTDPISYVEFAGNNGEQVSGNFSVDYSTGVLTPSPAFDAVDQKITVSVGKTLSSDASSVYIAVPPQNYTKGFTIKVVDQAGVTMTKRVGAVTLKAGKIYPTPVSEFEDDGTIKAFAKAYVTILDVWEQKVQSTVQMGVRPRRGQRCGCECSVCALRFHRYCGRQDLQYRRYARDCSSLLSSATRLGWQRY